MPYAFILSLLVGLWLAPLIESMGPLNQVAHNLCLKLSPESEYSSVYQSIVCAKRLREPGALYTIKNLGIMHLFVVSGAHLGLIARILKRIFKSKKLNRPIYGLLFCYLSVCLFQTPILRAFLSLITRSLAERFKLYWDSFDITLISVGLTLTALPQSYEHFSLIMSWVACLGIKVGRNLFMQSLFCFLFLIPIQFCFAPVSPLVVFTNTTIGFIISHLLFPMTLLSFVFAKLSSVCDFFWTQIFESPLLNQPLSSDIPKIKKFPQIFYWIYASCLHLTCQWMHRRSL